MGDINTDTNIYSSKRNATSTIFSNLSFDKKSKLNSTKVEIKSFENFAKSYLDILNDPYIYVKSDTDGSDIIIFFAIMESEVRNLIQTYVLEIIFTDFAMKDRLIFLQYLEKFSDWRLQTKDGKTLSHKRDVINFILQAQGSTLCELFLSKNS